MSKYDAIIIGGGIVGLASALQLLERKPGVKVAVLEKEAEVAKHQTGHNSGVIHSGIYYKPGSLKAVNCTEGYRMLLDFCDRESVPYDLCGKIIVATKSSELGTLQTIYERGVANGLEGIKKISVAEMKEREPHVTGIEGLYVPQTGIINYKKVAEKYAECIRRLGGEVHLQTPVTGMQQRGEAVIIETTKGTFEGKVAITCAGLYSDKVARMNVPDLDLKIIPFRGEYYEIKAEKAYLVKHLIYPVPDPNFPFLGVHFTRMIEGGVEAGPNAVLAYRREGYTKTDIHLGELMESLAWPGFQKVALKYWKTGLHEVYRSYSKAAFARALQPACTRNRRERPSSWGAGVRAQACDRDGGLLDDFKIVETARVVNVCNAPSPAATSSLSIGKSVSEMVLKKGIL